MLAASIPVAGPASKRLAGALDGRLVAGHVTSGESKGGGAYPSGQRVSSGRAGELARLRLAARGLRPLAWANSARLRLAARGLHPRPGRLRSASPRCERAPPAAWVSSARLRLAARGLRPRRRSGRRVLADNDSRMGGIPEGQAVIRAALGCLRRRSRPRLGVAVARGGPGGGSGRRADHRSRSPALATPPAAPVAPREPSSTRPGSRPPSSLDQRVGRTRRTAVELGIWNFDSAARVLLASGSRGRKSSTPPPPFAWRRTCPRPGCGSRQALWLHGESPVDALRVALAALAGIPRHLEASLWFAGTGLMIAAVGLLGGRPAVHRGGGSLCDAARGARSRRCDLGRDARLRARRLPGQPGASVLPLLGEGAARRRARAARDRTRLRRGRASAWRSRWRLLPWSRAPFRSPGWPARRCSPIAPIPCWTRRSPRRSGLRAARRSGPARRRRSAGSPARPARSRCRPRAAAGSAKPTPATRRCWRSPPAIRRSRTTRPTCASRSDTWSPHSRSTTARSTSRSRRWCCSTWRRPTGARSRSTAWRARSSAPSHWTASRWPS